MVGASAFVAVCKAAGLPEPIAEYQFAPPRKWRFDWAFSPDGNKVALEIDGGVWTHGRHTRGRGWHRDTEKLNRAAAMGWRVLRCSPEQFASGEILHDLAEAMTWMSVGGSDAQDRT